MAKELYLYTQIYDFVAQDLIAQIEENSAEDITLRVNTPGGSVFAGWGIIAKMQEHSGKFNIKLDGTAMSMGAILLVFADYVEALDVSTVMIHRASMCVENPEDQKFLDNVNKLLRQKLESKIDVAKLKELKNISIDEIFNSETQIDVFLTAKEAKQIGLIDTIKKITPNEIKAMAEINANASKYFKVAAEGNPNPINLNPEKMTVAELKAKHPELFNSIFESGVTAERDRVEAIMVYNEIDPVACKDAIASGKNLSQKQQSEFMLAAFKKESLAAAGGAALDADKTNTDEVDKKIEVTAKEKQIQDFATTAKKKLIPQA